MEIDLTLLHNNTVEEIDISNTYNIPKEYFENTDVISLDDVKVEGKIIRKGICYSDNQKNIFR